MNIQMKPCHECKHTFLEDKRFECELCSAFICSNCLEPCTFSEAGNSDDYECGGEYSLSHATHGLEICGSYVDCKSGEESDQKFKATICENHSDLCADCDANVCWNCVRQCDCARISCIDCGGYCHNCAPDGLPLCEDHIIRCRQEKCSLMFCEECSQMNNNMQYCKTCEEDYCIDHVEHQCSVK